MPLKVVQKQLKIDKEDSTAMDQLLDNTFKKICEIGGEKHSKVNA